MAAVVGVGATDFGPKGSGVVHVASVGELVENDIIAEGTREFH